MACRGVVFLLLISVSAGQFLWGQQQRKPPQPQSSPPLQPPATNATATALPPPPPPPPDAGLVVCSGGGDMFLETLSMIEQTRYRMKSVLPIMVAHCNELNADAVSILAMIPDVRAVDICAGSTFGREVKARLKGFFCKPAALLVSPFAHTMLVDSDVIWFKQPELLFHATEYTTTGTLFFRDRWTQTNNKLTLTAGQHRGDIAFRMVQDMADYIDRMYKGRPTQQQQKQQQLQQQLHMQQQQQQRPGNASAAPQQRREMLMVPLRNPGRNELLAMRNANVRRAPAPEQLPYSNHYNPRHKRAPERLPGSAADKAHAAAVAATAATAAAAAATKREAFTAADLAKTNAFWRHKATGTGFTPDHWQDSSVLLFDARMHPRTTQLLSHLLRDFALGYGDKEIYWLAATAAREPFAFEPHIVGSLGDCGAVVHFDPLAPTRAADPAAKIEPFYVNAEYLIDLKKIHNVGDFLSPREAQLTTAQRMDEQTTSLFALHAWKKMEHGFYPCGACVQFNCVPAASHVVDEIKVRQQLILLLKKNAPSSGTIASAVYQSLGKKVGERGTHVSVTAALPTAA